MLIKFNRKVIFLILVTVLLAVSLVYGDDDGVVVEEVKKDTENDLKVIKEDLTKQLPALVSGLFSSFRSASPVLLVTSAVVGALITAFMLHSPLSPFPVPPLPYPPNGRYPPTEMAIPVPPSSLIRDQNRLQPHHYKPVALGSHLRPQIMTLDKRPITSYNFGNNLRRESGLVNPYGGRSARNNVDVADKESLDSDSMVNFEEYMKKKADFQALTNEQIGEGRGPMIKESKPGFKYYFQEALRVLGEFLLELEKSHNLYPKNVTELCTDEVIMCDREARQVNVQSITNTLYMMGLVAAMFLTTYYFEPPSHQFNLDQFPPATRDIFGLMNPKNGTANVKHSKWYLIVDRVLRIIDLLERDQLRSKQLYEVNNGIDSKKPSTKNRYVRDTSDKKQGPFSLLATRLLRILDLIGLNHVAPTKNHDDHNTLEHSHRDKREASTLSPLARRILTILDLLDINQIGATKNHEEHNGVDPKGPVRDKRDLTKGQSTQSGGLSVSSIVSWADKLMSILDGIRTTRFYDDNNGIERKKGQQGHHREVRRVPVNDPLTVQGPDVTSRPMTWTEAIGQLIKTLGESLLGKLNYSECEKFDVFSTEFKDCLLSLKKSG